MKRRSALAVRPYGERLRPKVLDFLASVDVEATAPLELAATAPSERVFEYLSSHRSDLLVVPFHVFRTPEGEKTNGLELLAALRGRLPWTRPVPVVMPVSLFVTMAFEVACFRRFLDAPGDPAPASAPPGPTRPRRL